MPSRLDTPPARRPVGAPPGRRSGDGLPAPAPARRNPSHVRLRRRRATAVALLLVLALVGAADLVLGGDRRPGELVVGERYAAAWSAGDYRAMYAALSDGARARVSLRDFTAAHRDALVTATATRIRLVGPIVRDAGALRLPMLVRTRLLGTLRRDVILPLSGHGTGARVAWRPSLAFPGMPSGATRLRRVSKLPPRAALLAGDGGELAAGPDRRPSPSLADVASATVGTLRHGDDGPDASVGATGLERALDARLTGVRGERLLAGGRVLASVAARQAAPVRTSIVPPVQRAAMRALAGRVGGIVALDPRSGRVLAFAGIPFTGLQPPGSTFKIITAAGALEAGLAHADDTYPARTEAVLSGVALQNAHGEACGGTLVDAFAQSCNSVFAPLGARLGAKRLLDMARRFGFDTPPDIAGAATATMPATIGDDLALGSSAIGQGRVQATALTMATAAATIAMDGRRPRLTLAADGPDRAPTTFAVGAKVARTLQTMMRAVVSRGTGAAAALPHVAVAGKTGTAELTTTQACDAPPCPVDDPADTDAWFAAYAPASRPRVAVAVLLVRAGAGGDTAAPAARDVLQTALTR